MLFSSPHASLFVVQRVVLVVGDPTMASDHDPCLDAAAAFRHALKPGATTLAYACACPRRDPTTAATATASAAGATSPRGPLAFLSALAAGAGAGPGGLSPAKPLVTAPVFRSPGSTRAVVAFAATASAADL